jgi:hypothetical protein
MVPSPACVVSMPASPDFCHNHYRALGFAVKKLAMPLNMTAPHALL